MGLYYWKESGRGPDGPKRKFGRRDVSPTYKPSGIHAKRGFWANYKIGLIFCALAGLGCTLFLIFYGYSLLFLGVHCIMYFTLLVFGALVSIFLPFHWWIRYRKMQFMTEYVSKSLKKKLADEPEGEQAGDDDDREV